MARVTLTFEDAEDGIILSSHSDHDGDVMDDPTDAELVAAIARQFIDNLLGAAEELPVEEPEEG